MRKQGLGVSPIVQQNQEFSIQNEDFPALPGFKGWPCSLFLTPICLPGLFTALVDKVYPIVDRDCELVMRWCYFLLLLRLKSLNTTPSIPIVNPF